MAAPLATSRQGSVVPFTIVDSPDAWTAKDYEKDTSYLHILTPTDVQELDAAVAQVLATGKDLKDVSQDDFHLPTLAAKLDQVRQEAQSGRGFALIRGVPVWRYSRQESLAAYWIMGLYWGRAVPQNKKGHIIGHIKDIGHDPANPNTRLYATNAAQPWHNDGPADLVSLLCLKNARSGGLSGWSSSISVHNEILRRAPHLAKTLAGDWYFDRKGEVPEGKLPYFMIPVFNYYQGYLSVNYSDNYYKWSQRFPEVPRLQPEHYEAMALFNELACSKELRLELLLQPGDIQLLSNHTCLHYRSGFEDYEDIDEKRHLLRLWLAPPNDRPLPDAYAEIMGGSVVPGKRGGIFIQGAEPHIPLEAE